MLICDIMYIHYVKRDSIMTIHVDRDILDEWQVYFGKDLKDALDKAVKEVGTREVGDSLEVHIIFHPKLKPSKFSIRPDEPKLGGDAYIYVTAE